MTDPRRGDTLRTTFAPWLRLLDRRRGRLVAGAALMALTLLSAVGLLALSGWFITASALAGLAMVAGLAASLDVYVPGGGIRAFAVTRTVSRYLERLYNHDTVLRLLADLRGRLFGVLAALDDRALSRRRASDWLHRLTADIDTLDGLYLRLLAPPAVAALALLGLGGFLALWSPAVGAAVVVLLGLALAWITLGQARLGMATSHRQVADLERLRGRLIEQLQGLAELEAYGSLAEHRRRLDTLEARLEADQRRLGQRAALGNALVGVAVGVTLAAVLWLAALAHDAGTLPGPLVVMMALAVLAMNEALAGLPLAFTRLGATRAAAERLNALEAARPPDVEAGEGLPPGPPALSLEGVTLHYPGALVPALDDVSFSLAPGERLAITGGSGAGKSSVAALLAGRLGATEGRVRLGAIELGRLSPSRLAERVAMLTQRVDLFDDSLAANLRIADPAASVADLWRALAAVALADWAEALPHGLDTRVGEGGRRLSGGQARRLALARLVLRDPALVILDEPFAGLDAGTASRLARWLDEWLAGRTVVYLVHQLGGEVDPPGVQHTLQLVDGRLSGYT
ncbi:thiol reductant ABC exporter subunit CydC [Halomonas sp. LBP4]|uniref:thiol reductant ABC exporter subunit CydC n=1 Tax=Halomonas sp. LBP4 TaxID=2044917 RepID=UPI000D75B1B8|nr:thiol reductant ABC exporter subunit CydC [Halomonas sp. LBP4]PXX95598.1 thiol reductant ABC exporter subunit CydC [Halomonas sp. LBP4]